MLKVVKLIVFSALSVVLVACGSSSSESSATGGMGATDSGNNNAAVRSLNVVSWGGQYELSQVEAYHKPWTASTGNQVNSISYNGNVGDIEAQVNSGNIVWDIVDVELNNINDLCDQGFLEPIDATALSPGLDGKPATTDFISGTLHPCGVANIVWATVVAFNTDLVPASPTSIADFFDTTSFPGKRGIRKNPKSNLEMALLADGVLPSNVYSELSTNAGVERAFAKLDEIKEDIVWWDSGADSMSLLTSGDVVMTTTYNGRSFTAEHGDGQPVLTLWDGQVWDIDLWVIPKGAPNKDLALEFLDFATGTEPLANQASYIAYGPARKSSQALVGTHVEYGIDMQPELPTAAQNFQNALQSNYEFWEANGQVITERFDAWLEE